MRSIEPTLFALGLALAASLPTAALAKSSYFAAKHPRVDEMVVAPVLLPPVDPHRPESAYFHAPIPKVIHQIWFGDPTTFDQERTGGWRQLAAQYGYAYHLWTEDDDEYVAAQFGTELCDYLRLLRSNKRFDAASDVLRYHLIESLGGLYFDNDIPVPRDGNVILDPEDIWPLEGLVLTGEGHVREVENGAFYVQNHIMMAAPHHPVLVALTASILPNKRQQAKSFSEWKSGAIFLTGQALLSKTVRGTFTMISHLHLLSLGMDGWPDVGPYRAALRAKFLQQETRPEHIDSIHSGV